MAIYTIQPPTPIDALPTVPNRGHPTFSTQAHAYVLALANSVQPQQNALGLNVYNNAKAAEEQATAAAASAAAAQGAAQAAAATYGAVPWQSGGSYVAGSYPSTPPSCVFDPATPNITYRCISSHSGVATAPGSDPTRWAKLGETLLALREARVAMADNNVDLNAGAVFTKTITANTTLTVSNAPPSGTVATGVLRLTNAGAYAVTFWAGCKWVGGIVPDTFTASGVDLIGFTTDDGGVTYWLSVIGLDLK